MSKETIRKCDIEDLEHKGLVMTHEIEVIFDHDQEDGKSKTKAYLDAVTIELCAKCEDFMLRNRRYIYAYGAMGYNKYYLTKF